jgi:hypothetical protein
MSMKGAGRARKIALAVYHDEYKKICRERRLIERDCIVRRLSGDLGLAREDR